MCSLNSLFAFFVSASCFVAEQLNWQHTSYILCRLSWKFFIFSEELCLKVACLKKKSPKLFVKRNFKLFITLRSLNFRSKNLSCTQILCLFSLHPVDWLCELLKATTPPLMNLLLIMQKLRMGLIISPMLTSCKKKNFHVKKLSCKS